MIINGHVIASDPMETYHSKWWDARDRAYRPKQLNRFDLRKRTAGYYRGSHADQSWAMAKYLGRVRIVKTRRPRVL